MHEREIALSVAVDGTGGRVASRLVCAANLGPGAPVCPRPVAARSQLAVEFVEHEVGKES